MSTKKWKRTVAFVLVLLLLGTSVDVSSFAANEGENDLSSGGQDTYEEVLDSESEGDEPEAQESDPVDEEG